MSYPNPFFTASANDVVQAKINGVLYMSSDMTHMSEAYPLMSQLNHAVVVRCVDDALRCVAHPRQAAFPLKTGAQALTDGVDSQTGVLNAFDRALTPKVVGVLEERPDQALFYFYGDGIVSLMSTHSADEAFTVQLLRQIHSAA